MSVLIFILSEAMHWTIRLYFLCATINILLCANTDHFHPAVKKPNFASDQFRVATRIMLQIKINSADTKSPVPLEKYLIEKLQNETSARQNLENLCTSYEKSLWIATARSLMEDFEEIHGYNSVINKTSIPSELPYHGRIRQVRKMLMLWILKNRSDQFDVKCLIEEVQRSIERKEFTSVEDFVEAYASLYYELSIILKTRLLHPTRGPVNFEYSVWNKSVNKALPIFLSLFNLPKYPDKK